MDKSLNLSWCMQESNFRSRQSRENGKLVVTFIVVQNKGLASISKDFGGERCLRIAPNYGPFDSLVFGQTQWHGVCMSGPSGVEYRR